AEINQVQTQHREQHVCEVFGDVTRLVAGPDGRQRRKGDQIPHGAAKGARFAGNWFHRSLSSQLTAMLFCARSRSSYKNSSGGTKNGFSWRTPPIMTIGCVRRMFMTRPAPNRARS